MATHDGAARSYVGHSVSVADTQRGVLSIASIVDAIRRRLGLEDRHETNDR
jgi:hypothetical protein